MATPAQFVLYISMTKWRTLESLPSRSSGQRVIFGYAKGDDYVSWNFPKNSAEGNAALVLQHGGCAKVANVATFAPVI
ncbi:MAG: hypothetical protein M5U26_19750 [Planctomycetota bacterium]|nr:hypothetical protein [Planctomycetota bacterium]